MTPAYWREDFDGILGGRQQWFVVPEFPFWIGCQDYDPARIDDKRQVFTAGPRLLDMVEAHLDDCDTYHRSVISNGLRIVEARLATGRADAVEAPGTTIYRVAHVRTIAKVHSDEARFLVPIARGERKATCIQHVEHGAAGLGVHFGEIQIHRVLETRNPGISRKRDDLTPERDDARQVFVLSKRALEARRIEIELVGPRVTQPLDPDSLGRDPGYAHCDHGTGQHCGPRQSG